MSNQYASAWTPEMDAQLIALWNDGAIKSAEIGRIMGGMSRSKVGGRIRRLREKGVELASRSTQAITWMGNAPPPERRPSQPRPVAAPAAPPPPEPEYLGPVVSVALHAYRGCRYIVNDSWPALHCNREGFPWCDGHRGRIFNKVRA